jgi:hypothetical protein
MAMDVVCDGRNHVPNGTFIFESWLLYDIILCSKEGCGNYTFYQPETSGANLKFPWARYKEETSDVRVFIKMLPHPSVCSKAWMWTLNTSKGFKLLPEDDKNEVLCP